MGQKRGPWRGIIRWSVGFLPGKIRCFFVRNVMETSDMTNKTQSAGWKMKCELVVFPNFRWVKLNDVYIDFFFQNDWKFLRVFHNVHQICGIDGFNPPISGACRCRGLGVGIDGLHWGVVANVASSTSFIRQSFGTRSFCLIDSLVSDDFGANF